MTDRCPSELVLDRMFVGEPVEAEARQHVESCARCGRAIADRERVAAELAIEPGLSRLAGAVARDHRARRRRAGIAVAAGLAAAAAIALVAIPRGDDVASPEAPVVRRKGGLGLTVVAKRLDGRIEPVASPARLSPGEAIRFQITTATSGHLAILGLDAAGAVTPYVSALATPAGRDQLLEGSIVLDETLGAERIVAVLCEDELDMQELARTTRAALVRAGGDPVRVELAPRAGCAQTTFLLEKVPADR